MPRRVRKEDLHHIRTNYGKDGKPVSYTVRLELGPHPVTGERRTGTETYKDLGQAITRRNAWQVELDCGQSIDPTRLTVAELMQRWLAEDAAPNVKPSTLEDYADTVRVHIVAHLGKRRAAQLEPSDISQWRALVVQSTGNRAAQLAVLRLKQALAWAVRVELLKRNVAEGIAVPRTEEGDPRAVLTHAQARDFLTLAETDTYAPLWHVYLGTGMRRGEALGLRWQDVSLRGRTLSVRQQVALMGKPQRPAVTTLKSKAGRRTIEIDAELTERIRTHQAQQERIRARARLWEPHDLVFCTRNGLPLNPANLYRNFDRILDDCGLGDAGLTLHSLRHSHATFLLLAGMPLAYVSRRLGHARESITADIYSHLLPGFGELGRAALERALRGGDLPELGA